MSAQEDLLVRYAKKAIWAKIRKKLGFKKKRAGLPPTIDMGRQVIFDSLVSFYEKEFRKIDWTHDPEANQRIREAYAYIMVERPALQKDIDALWKAQTDPNQLAELAAQLNGKDTQTTAMVLSVGDYIWQE